jgi:hypothetical protein
MAPLASSLPLASVKNQNSLDSVFAPETFVLYYIQGNSHQVKQKFFTFVGDRGAAIARGKRHCEQMSYRFIRVENFYSSLEADEKRHTDNS